MDRIEPVFERQTRTECKNELQTRDAPCTRHVKTMLADEITKALGDQQLTVRAAQALTGVAAADFSRIRKADLGRFTVDRLMSIADRLGCRVEVSVSSPRRDVQRSEPVKKRVSA